MRRLAAVACAALVGSSLPLVSYGVANAIVPPSCGAPSIAGTTATVTCAYTGATQTFTFPTGVTQATFTVDGAAGADFTSPVAHYGDGGLGGESVGTITEPAGSVVTITVGGQGGNGGGGFGGGGAGNAAGGGGGSYVNDADTTLELAAGGGGGAGQQCQSPCDNAGNRSNGGAGGGTTGGQGTLSGSASGGTGGTQSQGGSAGGGAGQGGDGASTASGGGGGGYYGGGAGASFAGGGGGSGFDGGPNVAGGSMSSGVRSGNGVVTISYPAPGTTVPSASPPAGQFVGQPVTLTATVTAGSGGPDPTGTVTFADNGVTIPGCGAAPLSTSAGVTTATCSTSFAAAGSHPLTTTYSGDGNYSSGDPGTLSYNIETPAPQAPLPQLSVSAPSAATVGSPVTVTVTETDSDGKTTSNDPLKLTSSDPKATLPSAVSLSGGHASFPVTFNTTGQQTITAADSTHDLTATSDPVTVSTRVIDPTIVATVSSAHPKTPAGWYRSRVTVHYACTPGSAPLTGACPGPVTMRHNGRHTLIRTITATDGGSATSTSHVAIDRTPPTVKIHGVHNGRTYAHRRDVTCSATDGLSGVAGSCVVQYAVCTPADHVNFVAVATDNAGNTTSKPGHYRLRGSRTGHCTAPQ